VAEPTVFGLHNLKMVLELVALFNKPFGIILNKCQDGDNPTREYCEVNKLPVLTIIPYDEKLGYIHSIGSIAVKEDLKYQKIFSDLLETIEMEASL
jgi:MinD superfamily P-loop ATPase